MRVNLQEILKCLLGLDQAVVQIDFRVAEDHGEFRPGETELAIAALIDFRFIRQKFDSAIQQAGAFQVGNQ